MFDENRRAVGILNTMRDERKARTRWKNGWHLPPRLVEKIALRVKLSTS